MIAMNGKKRTEQQKIDNILMFLRKEEDRNALIEFGLLNENLELEGGEIYKKFKAFKKAAGY